MTEKFQNFEMAEMTEKFQNFAKFILKGSSYTWNWPVWPIFISVSFLKAYLCKLANFC